MRGRIRHWLLALWAASIVGLLALNVVRPLPGLEDGWPWATGLMAFPVASAVVLARRPRNTIGRLLGLVAMAAAIIFSCSWYAVTYADTPLSRTAEAISTAGAVAQFGGLLGLLHLFPSGQSLSRRHRRVVGALAFWVTSMAILALLRPGPLELTGRPNPLGVAPEWTEDVFSAGVYAGPVLALLGIWVIGVRHRRAGAVERAQLKWFAVGAAAVLLMLLMITFVPQETTQMEEIVAGILVVLAFWSLPAAIVVAIIRYRLYDIDLVINRALVYGTLAFFITAVYVAIVAGLGALVGRAGQANLPLAIAATAIVAVAFQPVRHSVQRWANRLVYGERATPYEVLSAFSARMADEVPMEERLTRMARLLAEGTNSRRADVWLVVGQQVRPAASWPVDDVPTQALPLSGDGLPHLGPVTAVAPVRHHDELFGALTVTKPAAEALTPVEQKLLTDLAAQAGLVLRNVRLTTELLDNVAELRRSRQRLVAAQDTVRRRLERDLHDGAQQQLVALKMRVALVKRLATEEEIAALLDQLLRDADEAIDTLRDLARGIYPPLLAAEGLPAALRAQARKSAVPVTVEADGFSGRFDENLEAAVYFCCLEALQNIAKYANATRASIKLDTSPDGQLRFQISDDGDGFDAELTPKGAGLTNMADRIDALSGTLRVRSRPGAGTTISGSIPVSDPVGA